LPLFTHPSHPVFFLTLPSPHQVPKFQYFPGDFNSIFVPTVETTRLTYFLDSLIPNKHHVMFVGNTGELVTRIKCRELMQQIAEAQNVVCGAVLSVLLKQEGS
jgi:dynein heavy chain